MDSKWEDKDITPLMESTAKAETIPLALAKGLGGKT